MPPEVRFLYVTVPDREVGLGLAHQLVGEGLVACGNLLGPVTSVYEWNGQIEQGDELVLLLKTRAALVDRVLRRVVELHPYDCPCVAELPLGLVHPAFAAWVEERTAVGSGEPAG